MVSTPPKWPNMLVQELNRREVLSYSNTNTHLQSLHEEQSLLMLPWQWCLINQIGGVQSSASLTTFSRFPGTKMLEYGIESGISYVLPV